MAKHLGFLFLCLFVIAGALYLSATLNTVRSLASSPADFTAGGVAQGPTTINFNFFGTENPSGKSEITQGYGTTPYSYLYKNHWHDGVDIAATYGETIHSPNSGIVLATGNMDDYCYHEGFGKYVAVEDPANSLILFYAHLGTIGVSAGQSVSSGTAIGTVGSTGYETGVHLHFSIFESAGFAMKVAYGCGPEPIGQDVDPLNYLGSVYQ